MNADQGMMPAAVEADRSSKTRRLWGRINVVTIAASVALVLVVGSIVWLNRSALFGPIREDVAATPIFYVPVVEQGVDRMGYVGSDTIPDSVVVQLFTEGPYTNHYRFKDTLQLFSKPMAANAKTLRLEYNSHANTYDLTVEGKKYQLERGFNRINRLEPK